MSLWRRLLTEAWIETRSRGWPISHPRRRLLTEAWIETVCGSRLCRPVSSPPHGGVDRNIGLSATPWTRGVASSRRRGSKLLRVVCRVPVVESPPHGGVDRNSTDAAHVAVVLASPPHGGVDRNPSVWFNSATTEGRLLTEAWIETGDVPREHDARIVASSRRRGSKQCPAQRTSHKRPSPPHGGVDRNASIECRRVEHKRSPPHGGVDRNPRDRMQPAQAPVASSRRRGSKLRIRSFKSSTVPVASSRRRGSKHHRLSQNALLTEVASSRRRGSKPFSWRCGPRA